MLKSVVPKTQLQSYTPGQEVNFDIFVEGQALVPGTVFLTGKFTPTNIPGGATPRRVFIDPLAGISSCMENVIVRCSAYQEVITNYARYVKMNNALQYSPDSLCAGLKPSCELLAPHQNVEAVMLIDADLASGMPFAHKLMNSLNNMSGNLSFAKAGRVQLSFKLPPPSKVFYGTAAAGCNYSLSELELHYMTSDMAADTVTINTVEDTQKNIATSDTTIANTFINQVDKLVVSFADITCETDGTKNALACQHPRIERVSWMYNDVSNQLVSYEIETQEEMVLSALNIYAVRSTGIDIREFQSAVVQDGLKSFQDKFMLGLNLGKLMDFSTAPVGLNLRLTSDANFQQTYAYFYGFGQQTV
jgi:hypothetical protein